jgi:hypothetical protein
MPDVVWSLNETVNIPGVLFVTNYQLQFLYAEGPSGKSQQRCVATMGSITRVEKVGGQKSGQLFGKERQVVIHRKDFHREVTLTLRGAKSGDRKVRFCLLWVRCITYRLSVLETCRNDQQICLSG